MFDYPDFEQPTPPRLANSWLTQSRPGTTLEVTSPLSRVLPIGFAVVMLLTLLFCLFIYLTNLIKLI